MDNWLGLLKEQRAIAVIRSHQMSLALGMAQSVAKGGMKIIEITWNTERAGDLIGELRRDFPNCLIGAGTLLNLDDLQGAIDCGAQFLFTPHTDALLIKTAVNQGLPIIPGALSPTEIITAWQAGATCVKVFPISAVGGASYLKTLQGPIGQIPLIPTGGITVNNAKSMIDAGAIAVGLSGDLFPKELVKQQSWDMMSSLATNLLNQLH